MVGRRAVVVEMQPPLDGTESVTIASRGRPLGGASTLSFITASLDPLALSHDPLDLGSHHSHYNSITHTQQAHSVPLHSFHHTCSSFRTPSSLGRSSATVRISTPPFVVLSEIVSIFIVATFGNALRFVRMCATTSHTKPIVIRPPMKPPIAAAAGLLSGRTTASTTSSASLSL